jgi:hypothetical protein
MADAFSERLNTSVLKIGAALAAAFSIDRIIAFGKELADIGVTIEQTEARARVLLGGAFEKVAEGAQAAGEEIGLSKNEYLGLVTVAQDVFTNLGLAADSTVDLSEQIVAAAGGIEDFTAGQVDAASAVNILKNAVLGNTKGLKELNIPVKASKDEIAALALQIQKAQGVTLAQAEGLANLQFTLEAVNPKLAEFAKLNGDADKAQDKATASFKNAKEELARGLQPALTSVTQALANVISGLTEIFTSEGDITGRKGVLSNKAGQAKRDANAYLDAINKYIDANKKLEESENTLALAQRQQALVRSAIDRADSIQELARAAEFYKGKLAEAEKVTVAYGIALVN